MIKDNLNFSLSIAVPFISLSFSILQTKYQVIYCTGVVKENILLADFIRKAFSFFSPFNMIIGSRFHISGFYLNEIKSFSSCFLPGVFEVDIGFYHSFYVSPETMI